MPTSRNRVNLLQDKRTYSVTLENRKNLLDKSNLIFPKIPNSNLDKKFHTLETENYENKYYSSIKPSCFLEMPRNELEKKLFEDKFDRRFDNLNTFQTLDEKERTKKNKSFILPSTKNNFLMETKHRTIDSSPLLKESKT